MTDLTELFSRDPHKLTRNDIDKMVTHFRDKRKLFVAPAAPVKRQRKAPLVTGVKLSFPTQTERNEPNG